MAFDRLQLGDILSILTENKVSANITGTIHSLNTNNATKVKTGPQLTENITTPGRIRQDDSLNPFLFNFPMGEIIKKVKFMNLGYSMDNKRFGMVC